MNMLSKYTKLDGYTYDLLFADGKVYMVYIPVDGQTDVTIADISTETTGSEGHIYVEGHYLKLKKMWIENTVTRGHRLCLSVEELGGQV